MIRQNQLILVSLIAFLVLLPAASHSVVVTCGSACVTSADAKSDTTKCLVIYSNYVYKLGSYSPSKFSDHDHFACGDDLTSNMKSSHKSSPSKYLTPYKCAPICPVVTPTFSPAAGTYSSAQSVTLSTTTAGATIRYTLDGTTPTATSTAYTAPITISSTKTVKANAWKTGMTTSSVATAIYTISLSAVAAPTFSPVAGTYPSAQVSHAFNNNFRSDDSLYS